MNKQKAGIYVKSYAIKVLMPLSGNICVTVGTPASLERMFTSFRECVAKTHKQKVEYDCVRALLKYAVTFNATYCEIDASNNDVEVTLYFKELDNMIKFCDGMEQAIENSAMK